MGGVFFCCVDESRRSAAARLMRFLLPVWEVYNDSECDKHETKEIYGSKKAAPFGMDGKIYEYIKKALSNLLTD